MLKTESVTLDGIVFETSQLPAMAALELLSQLVKTVGPALGILMGSDPDDDLDLLAPQLASALKDLKPAELSGLAVDLLKLTVAKVPDATGGRLIELTSKEALNTVFSGRLMTMFKVLIHSVKVNYGDFFGGSVPSAPPTPKLSAP